MEFMPDVDRSPYDELLEIVRKHVEKYGHRRLYSVQWHVIRRFGFSCEDCEETGTEFVAMIDYDAIVRDPRAGDFVGPAGREAFLAWLAQQPSPHDRRRELPSNAWQHLLTPEEE